MANCDYLGKLVTVEEVNENHAVLLKVVSITEANGKLVIMFENATHQIADLDIIDNGVFEALSKESLRTVNELKEKVGKLENQLINDLVEVSDLAGQQKFRGVK